MEKEREGKSHYRERLLEDAKKQIRVIDATQHQVPRAQLSDIEK
jgi:hypothetical protein